MVLVLQPTPDGSGYCTLNYPLTLSNNSLVRVKPLFAGAEVNFTISNAPKSGGTKLLLRVAGGTVRNIEV